MRFRNRLINTKVVFILGALGALLFGYDNGIVAGAILFIPDEIPLTPLIEGMVVSSAVIGAMIGAISSGPVADRIGRQRVLLAASVVFLIGAAGSGFAPTAAVLVTSRLILGLGIGISSVVVPLYLAEMAPADKRGIATSMNQYMVIIGTGVAGGVAFTLSFSGSWRWMLVIGVFPALVLLGGMLLMPDTPRSLVRRGDPEMARSVLHRLRENPEKAEEEFAEITELANDDPDQQASPADPSNAALARAKGPGKFSERWVKRLLVVGVLLAVFQQVTGINAVVYYSPTVLTDLGLTPTQSLLFSFLNGILNIVTIAVTVQLKIVDRRGRKPMLLAGLAGLVISTAAIGLVTIFGAPGTATQIVVTILAFVVFTNVFSATWGPVLWVMLAEIFPLRIRGFAMGIATLFNWLAAFAVSQAFPILQHGIGAGPIMIAFAIIGVIIMPIVARWVPETMDRSLEELENDFRTGATPIVDR
ncbi:sugar porter family MFS transporter [Rothia uropygialis]|uniref:sugar porter family MFS transporter n=1 Tax=Kocuria sp. 36 TaxID=1415402 RepID=UPI0013ED1083|nr:sugar porter family MFS transporter [Kocuria sp. 36]